MMFSRQFWADLTERVVSTFAQAVLGAGTIIDFGSAKTYEIAGVAAAVAALKGLAALRVGAKDSASLLPENLDPPKKDGGHAGIEGLLLTALAIALGLCIWSLVGAHTDLF